MLPSLSIPFNNASMFIGELHIAKQWHQASASVLLQICNKEVERNKQNIRSTQAASPVLSLSKRTRSKWNSFSASRIQAAKQWNNCIDAKNLSHPFSNWKLIRNQWGIGPISRICKWHCTGNMLSIPIPIQAWDLCRVCLPWRFCRWVKPLSLFACHCLLIANRVFFVYVCVYHHVGLLCVRLNVCKPK